MTQKPPAPTPPVQTPPAPRRRRRKRRRLRPSSGRRTAPTAILAAPFFLAIALGLAFTGTAARATVQHALINPNLALPLLLAGILLLYLEFNRPGTVLPAALGILAATLALFGLSHLPLSRVALVAIAVALTLLTSEIFLPLRNVAAAIAAAVLAFGLARLVHNPEGLPATHLPVHPAVALLCAFIFIGVTLFLARIALSARRLKRLPAPASSSSPPDPLPPRHGGVN